MVGQEQENEQSPQRRLLIKRNKVRWEKEPPIDRLPTQAVRVLEWTLAWRRIHWLDGFVLFTEWLRGGQEGFYRELMLNLVGKANGALAELGLSDLHIEAIPRGGDEWFLEHTQRALRPRDLPLSNVAAGVRAATTAKALFQSGESQRACERLIKAHREWFDADLTAEAVCAALDSADAAEALARLPVSILAGLQEHAVRLLFAIGAVWGAARTDPTQFSFELANPVLAGWAQALTDVSEALTLLRRGTAPAEALVDDDVREFVRLANCYLQSLPAPDERGTWKSVWRGRSILRRGRSSPEHAEAVELSAEERVETHERDRCLEKLVGCALVRGICDVLRAERELSAGGRTDTRADDAPVEAALQEFLAPGEPITPTPYLYGQLRRHIKLAIASESRGRVLQGHGHRPSATRREVVRALETLLTGAIDLDIAISSAVGSVRRDVGSGLHSLVKRALRQRQPELPLPRGLRLLSDELRARSAEPPQWFRKSGPSAADFRDGRVYRPDDLIDTVREQFRNSHVVILKGERATGKSVLARWLAYDWGGEEFEDAYYLDRGLERNLDLPGLSRFVRQSDGLFILENMHLEPQNLQRLWSELKDTDLDGYVLITTRPIPHADSRLEPLETLPMVSLAPCAYAQEIIRAFASRARNPEVFASDATLSALSTIAKNDYWLLTYALDACDAVAGSGDPKTWIADGVREDLRDLELARSCFPRILLSLAPLAMAELSTAGPFLTHELGFSDAELLELVQRCEIARSEHSGQFYYGLPHASLATAYWEHGQAFRRKQWGLEEFIYRYATADTPNALEALATAPEHTFRAVDARIEAEGLMSRVLMRERSMKGIQLWAGRRAADYRLREPFLTHIADRLHASERLDEISDFLSSLYCANRQVADAFLSVFVGPQLGSRLNERATIGNLCWFFKSIDRASSACQRRICAGLDTSSLAVRLNAHTASDPCEVCDCIAAVHQADHFVGDRLWAAIDIPALGEALSADPDVWSVCDTLRDLRSAHELAAVALARTLSFERLIAYAQELPALGDAVFCVTTLAGLAQQVGKSVTAMLDAGKLAMRIGQLADVERMVRCAASLFDPDPGVGTSVWEPLRPDLSRRVNAESDAKRICRCIEVLHQVNPAAATALWSAYPHADPKRYIDHVENLEEAIESVCMFYRVDRACGGEPRVFADPARIAALLEADEDITRVCGCLRSLFQAAEDIGAHAWSLMNHGQFAQRLNQLPDLYAFETRATALAQGGERLLKATEALWDEGCLTQHIVETDRLGRDLRHLCDTLACCHRNSLQLRQRIDWSRLAERLNQTDDTAVVAAALRQVRRVDKDVAATIWCAIDKRALAARLGRLESGYDLALALGDFCRADPNMAQELWTHIKESGRLTQLAETMTRVDADTLVDFVRLWNKQDAVELTYLLSAKGADLRKIAQSPPPVEDRLGAAPGPTGSPPRHREEPRRGDEGSR